MAVINPPGFLQNAGATHTAEQMRNWHGLLIAGKTGATTLLPRGGVNPALGSALQVTQTGSPSMAVVVKSGHAAIPGTEHTKQGVYSVMNDADVTLSIAASHATLNRIDIVVFKIEDQAYSGSVNSSSLAVVTGTPASSPSAPAAPANSIILASVSIVANDTSITNAEITDLRFYMSSLGGLLSVKDQAEETALVVHEALALWRRDIDSIKVYDGAAFREFNATYRARQTLGGTASLITFSSIPSNLRRLSVYWTSRGNDAAALQNLLMRINNDSGTNYSVEYHQGAGGAAQASFLGNQTSAFIGASACAGATANLFAGGVVDIVGWDSPHSAFLTWTTCSGTITSGGIATNTGGVFAPAGPYTRLDFLLAAGSFVSGTDFQLEGTYA